jgi:hypothetical protein
LLTVVLLRLLNASRRFGPLATDVTRRLSQSTPEQLEIWAERVLDARTIDEVSKGAVRGELRRRWVARGSQRCCKRRSRIHVRLRIRRVAVAPGIEISAQVDGRHPPRG